MKARATAKPRAPAKTRSKEEAPPRRTSEILRQILADNPQDMISVDQIVKSLGTTSFGTSLMVFSIPEVIPIPVPGMSAIVALPTGLLSAQMIMGNGEIRLPKALLKRSIPRKAFATAVKTILPFLERAEKKVRPRWKWATSAAAKRFLGVLIFVLACVIALPIPMTNMPPAIAIFIIALGLVERDGKLIAAGVALGLASIALIGGAFLGLFSLFGGTALIHDARAPHRRGTSNDVDHQSLRHLRSRSGANGFDRPGGASRLTGRIRNPIVTSLPCADWKDFVRHHERISKHIYGN